MSPFAYELHQARHADLIREAEEYRLAREATGRGRRGRPARGHERERRVSAVARQDGQASVQAARA